MNQHLYRPYVGEATLLEMLSSSGIATHAESLFVIVVHVFNKQNNKTLSGKWNITSC